VWAAKAKHESENGNREYPRNMSSPIYIKENLQKSSWSNDGVTRFNELMEEVEQDRNSAEGKQFEIVFQSEMAGSSGNRGKKRKASSEMVQPRNDLCIITHVEPNQIYSWMHFIIYLAGSKLPPTSWSTEATNTKESGPHLLLCNHEYP
jgi:hypothetical protein